MNIESTTLKEIVDRGIKLTPMMEQYYSVKKEYPDTLVLFRMGDFYELFFEDARRISELLNITLTHRGKLGDLPIPMAGIPHHAASNYIDRLTSQGLKVVICEQIENPKDAVGIVKRAVTQIASPAMPYDIERSDASEHNYLSCAFLYKNQDKKEKYLALFLDFTTGDFEGISCASSTDLIECLEHFNPKEFVTYFGQWPKEEKIDNYLKKKNILKTYLRPEYFDSKNTEIYIEKAIPYFKKDKYLKMLPFAYAPIGALTYYVFSTQGENTLKHLKPFRLHSEKNQMRMAHSTYLSLEMLPKSKEDESHSLFAFMNHTVTPSGEREFRLFFQNPLCDLAEILRRQNCIKFFHDNLATSEDIILKLKRTRDIQRLLAKISTNRSSSQDLIGLSNTIKLYYQIIEDLQKKSPSKDLWACLSVLEVNKEEKSQLLQNSKKALASLNDELGASLEKGNLIKFGVNKERDRLWKLCQNTEEELANLEQQYRKKSGISKLKIKSNNINGLFIEITKSHGDKVPESFKRFQTLVNAERFTTPDLEEFEKELMFSKDKLHKVESDIFSSLMSDLLIHSKVLQQMSWSLAHIDIFLSLAKVSRLENFTCPQFQEKKIIHLENCWHPLIKLKSHQQFIPHQIHLDQKNYFALITGPNMAGKTTVMREIAICQALAQIGSFIPAEKAILSLCDSLFCRIGASDDIARGQSTFMVEMSETSEIIRHATEKSLVILDELGRGTSTYDGLSLAWALTEQFVHKVKCLTLFATHYHELIEVVDKLPNAKNFSVETKVDKDEVHFLYRFIEGGVGQSYGIFVAKLAGIPPHILTRANQLLSGLENKQDDPKNIPEAEVSGEESGQLDLFSHIKKTQDPKKCSEQALIVKYLKKIDINHLTPLEALLKLNELKQLFKE